MEYPELSLTPEEREVVVEKVFQKWNQPFKILKVQGLGKKTVKIALRSGARVTVVV